MITLNAAFKELEDKNVEVSIRDCLDLLEEINEAKDLIAHSKEMVDATFAIIALNPCSCDKCIEVVLQEVIKSAICKGIWLGRRQFTDLGENNDTTNSGPTVEN